MDPQSDPILDLLDISDVSILKMLTDVECRFAILGMHQLVPLGL